MAMPCPPLRRGVRRLAGALFGLNLLCQAASADTLPAAAPGNAAEDAALNLALVYKLDVMGNRGGRDAAGRPVTDGSGTAMGNLDVMLRGDLDRLWGWSNSVFYLHLLNDHGGKQNGRHAGTLMGLSNVEVATNTTKLFHAWVQRSFLDERLSLLGGLYPIDSEFSVLESAALFVHPSLGPPADLAMTRGPSIFNTSAVGLRLRWEGEARDRYAMAAVLDGIPGDPADPHGTHIRFDAGDGIFAIAEVGYTPPEFGHVFEPSDPSSPIVQGMDIRQHEKFESFGKYALGLWAYSERVDDLLAVDAAGNPLRRPSRGGYLLAETTVYRQPGSPVHNLALFSRLSLTDDPAAPFRTALNLGLRLREPLAGREDDSFGIAWNQARFSDRYRRAEAAAGNSTAAAESAWEISYRLQWTPWLALQPMAQYVRHPGGDPGVAPVRVLGLRLELGPL